jgi:apolipoprotein N-acyltransferase
MSDAEATELAPLPAPPKPKATVDSHELRLRWIYGAVGLSAILSFVSFHPVNAGVFAYVALLPLLFVAARETPRVGAGMAYAATTLYHIPGLAWIAMTTPSGWLTTAFMEGVYGIVLVCLPLWIRKRSRVPLMLSLPLLGATLECIRANTPFISFPWLLWGHSQHEFLTLVQVADITSVYGLTAFVLLVNGALADAALLLAARREAKEDPSESDLRRLGWIVGLPVLIGLAIFGYGYLRMSQVQRAMDEAQDPGPRVLVIQVDVPQSLKDGLGMTALELASENLRMSMAALKWNGESKVDAMLWSETMWPWPMPDRRPEAGRGVGYDAWYADLRADAPRSYLMAWRQVHRELFRLPLSINAPLLLGAMDYGHGGGQPHNSYYQLSPDGKGGVEVAARYDKVELVPVSEYIPYKDPTSWMHWFFRFMKGFVPPGFDVFERGKGPVLMDVGKWKFSPNICFEISFPELLRRGTLEGADVHVCPANDAWFVRGTRGQPAKATAEIGLARAHTRLRAIENRRSIVRCVNRGVSLCMDPTGRVVDEISVGGKGGAPRRVGVASYLGVRVPVVDLRSFYVRFGNVFAMLCGLGILILLRAAWRGKLLFEETYGLPRRSGGPSLPSSGSQETLA